MKPSRRFCLTSVKLLSARELAWKPSGAAAGTGTRERRGVVTRPRPRPRSRNNHVPGSGLRDTAKVGSACTRLRSRCGYRSLAAVHSAAHCAAHGARGGLGWLPPIDAVPKLLALPCSPISTKSERTKMSTPMGQPTAPPTTSSPPQYAPAGGGGRGGEEGGAGGSGGGGGDTGGAGGA